MHVVVIAQTGSTAAFNSVSCISNDPSKCEMVIEDDFAVTRSELDCDVCRFDGGSVAMAESNGWVFVVAQLLGGDETIICVQGGNSLLYRAKELAKHNYIFACTVPALLR